MPVNYSTIKTEILTDPLGLGYAPHITDGNDQAIANILNTPRPGVTIARTLVDAWEFINAIVPSEYIALTTASREYLVLVASAGRVQLGGGGVRTALTAIFAPGTTTRANFQALLAEPGTRAEELLGSKLLITPADIAIARRS